MSLEVYSVNMRLEVKYLYMYLKILFDDYLLQSFVL